MAGRWELTDEQWLLVEPMLRGARRADNRGRPWHDTRAVLNGVLWVLGTGPIRGFAVVLTLGIATSMFTSLMGSRALLTLMYGGRRKIARLSI